MGGLGYSPLGHYLKSDPAVIPIRILVNVLYYSTFSAKYTRCGNVPTRHEDENTTIIEILVRVLPVESVTGAELLDSGDVSERHRIRKSVGQLLIALRRELSIISTYAQIVVEINIESNSCEQHCHLSAVLLFPFLCF